MRLEAKRQSREVYTASNLKRGQKGRALLQPNTERALSELCLCAGFTLLEILIAIAILALVVSSLYGAYSGTIETTEKVENLRDIDQTARLALMQMADDFKCLYYKKAESDEEDSPFRFSSGMEAEGEEETVVEFASTSHLGFDLNFPSLRINRIRYALVKQLDNERQHKLVRIEIPFADLPGEREEIKVELADSVESLTLTYQDEDGQSLPQWDTKEKGTEGLPPRLVNIQLQMAGDKSRVFTAAVALPAWVEEEETKGSKEYGQREETKESKVYRKRVDFIF